MNILRLDGEGGRERERERRRGERGRERLLSDIIEQDPVILSGYIFCTKMADLDDSVVLIVCVGGLSASLVG